jgi:hypothetical protein
VVRSRIKGTARAPRMPVPLPTKLVMPKKRPRLSTGMIFAIISCQPTIWMPPPRVNHANSTKNVTRARPGWLVARKYVAGASSIIGSRSRKKPRVTGKNFFRGARSTQLATNNCGRRKPAEKRNGIRPIRIGLVVKWLTNRGRITVDEIKLIPNQKLAPSSELTRKFQRKFRSISF